MFHFLTHKKQQQTPISWHYAVPEAQNACDRVVRYTVIYKNGKCISVCHCAAWERTVKVIKATHLKTISMNTSYLCRICNITEINKVLYFFRLANFIVINLFTKRRTQIFIMTVAFCSGKLSSKFDASIMVFILVAVKFIELIKITVIYCSSACLQNSNKQKIWFTCLRPLLNLQTFMKKFNNF